jgi:hypothetical protein
MSAEIDPTRIDLHQYIDRLHHQHPLTRYSEGIDQPNRLRNNFSPVVFFKRITEKRNVSYEVHVKNSAADLREAVVLLDASGNVNVNSVPPGSEYDTPQILELMSRAANTSLSFSEVPTHTEDLIKSAPGEVIHEHITPFSDDEDTLWRLYTTMKYDMYRGQIHRHTNATLKLEEIPALYRAHLFIDSHLEHTVERVYVEGEIHNAFVRGTHSIIQSGLHEQLRN